MEIDDYEIHTDLVEKFISKGDKTAFKKMLNMNLTNNNNKLEKQKENLIKKQQFMNSMKQKKPSYYYNNLHINHFNDNYKAFNPNEINSFKLDFHNLLQDPEYKDKCMKGNYKWGNMKFQMMKANLAKRKGIPIEELKMPKIWSKKKSSNMEMNGNFIINNNIDNYKKFNSMNIKVNLKEDNKNGYSMNKLQVNKMPSINKKFNESYKRQMSHRINNTNAFNTFHI